eukprot:12420040-Karenia_brevis.AAC.1
MWPTSRVEFDGFGFRIGSHTFLFVAILAQGVEKIQATVWKVATRFSNRQLLIMAIVPKNGSGISGGNLGTGPTNLQAALKARFQAMPSITHRFGQLTPILMQKVVDDVYLERDNVDVDYLSPDGKKELLMRSPLNDRYEEQTIKRYEQRILESGVMSHCRGRPPIKACGKAEDNMYYLMTNGSVTTALYRCWKKFPNNEQVQESIRQKLQGCKIYHRQIPADVEEWIILQHN